MEFIAWLLLGLVAGIAAMLAVFRTFPSEPMQWLGALAVGLIGGWLGGWLTNLIGLEQINWLGSLVIGFIGAALVLLAIRKGLGATTAS